MALVVLSWFCIIAGLFFGGLGYLITFNKKFMVYFNEKSNKLLSVNKAEVVGSNLLLLGIISPAVGFVKLEVPEIGIDVFYFLILVIFHLSILTYLEKDED